MAKIDLKKLKQHNEDIYKTFWLNLDTSLVGSSGVGKSTWALEQTAYVAGLFEETIPVYYIDTEGAIPTMLQNEIILDKLINAGVDLDVINVAEYIDKHGLLKGLEKFFADVTRIRREITKMNTPGIMVVDSLSDLRQRLVDAFVEARKGEKESLIELLKKDTRNLQDWQKTAAVLNDLTSIAKNTKIHAIFTSREKLEKDGDVLVPVIDGHKSIEYECDAHIRLFFEEDVVNGQLKKVRKAEILKIRGINTEGVPVITGGFEAFRKFVDSHIKK